MEAVSRPPRRRDTLSRKLFSGHGFSSSSKHAYDGVFIGTKRGASSRSSGIDDYGEIFGGSRGSSIPVLDLTSLDESEVLAGKRSSELDYSNIFGGICKDALALSYEEVFEKPPGATKLQDTERVADNGASSSTSSPSSSIEQLDKMKTSKEIHQVSIEEPSSDSVDGTKQFNMSYHKTGQQTIEIKNRTTHVVQMRSTPGYTRFIDENSSFKKTVSDEHPEISQSQPLQSKTSPPPNLGANLADGRRQHKRSVTADFKGIPKRNSLKDDHTEFSSYLSDEDEVDLNATAAASVAALRKAIETAQVSIRIAKEIMERKGGAQRFEVKKKKSKDILRKVDVSEKDIAKQGGKFVPENENYNLGLAKEIDRRTKDTTTIDNILGQPNRNGNLLQEDGKVEAGNTLQDNYTDNKPVATDKIHDLEDKNKAGIFPEDEKLKEDHKLQTEESDNKRINDLEIARQLNSDSTCKVHELGGIDKVEEVSQDDIKMVKQEASPEECDPVIECLPTEECDQSRVCEVEVTKWDSDGSENHTDSSLIATYEVHVMEGVSLNEEKMKDEQETSFEPGSHESEINECLLIPEESNVEIDEDKEMDNMTIPQADKESDEDNKTQEEHIESVEIEEHEEMDNLKVPQDDKEAEENEKDFSIQEEHKESVEVEEHEEMDNTTVPQDDKESKENEQYFSRQEEYKETTVEIDSTTGTQDEEEVPKVFSRQEEREESMDKEVKPNENVDGCDEYQMSKDVNDKDLHESHPSATCELKGVWKNRYLSSWWGAINKESGENENEKDDNNEHETKLTGADALKGVWKSRYLASESGINKEADKDESKEKEATEIENELENKLKGTTTCELKGVWKTRYLASDWRAIKQSPVKEAEEGTTERVSDPVDIGKKEEQNMNDQNEPNKEYDTEESVTSVGDASDDDDNDDEESGNLDYIPDVFATHLKAFQDEIFYQENLEAAAAGAKMVDLMTDQMHEEPEVEEGKNQRLQNEDDSDFSSSSHDDKSYESFSEENEKNVEEIVPKMEETEAKETKEQEEEEEEEHLRRTAEMDQKKREKIVVERAIREARERAFTDARERAERAAVERATAEVKQRAMAEAREKIEKAATSSNARLRAERAAVERATSEARERAREKAALSQKASSSKEPPANNDQQGTVENNGESAQRRKAKQERNQRTMERAAKALAEKNQRDLKSQKEQAERNRFAETLDAEVKRWSTGKEGNLRALLSTLQYILGPDSGWQPVTLTEIITTAAVKKAYRRANLHVHPDKLQQRGATIQQKYICEKVFDLLKAAWNKFNSEER